MNRRATDSIVEGEVFYYLSALAYLAALELHMLRWSNDDLGERVRLHKRARQLNLLFPVEQGIQI